MSGHRIWLAHPETGGVFHCPVEAVEDWLELGWRRGSQPVEPNPVTAEMPKPPVPAAEPAEESTDSTPNAGTPAEGSE